jgi:hypothetical protein
MSTQLDLLEDVVGELCKRQGDLPKVARETGIAYDTVLRIKNRQNDPGYSKVLALHRYLFGPTEANQARS